MTDVDVECYPDEVLAFINSEFLTIDLRFLSKGSVVVVHITPRMAIALNDRLEELLKPWIQEVLRKTFER